MIDKQSECIDDATGDQDPTSANHLVPEDDDRKSGGFYRRLVSDVTYRRRLVATCSVYWGFVVQGISLGQFGPSFPDLRQIINEDLQTSSWLVTSTFFGYLLGSLISGILYDKYNRMALLIASLLGMAVTTAALPWCPYFWLMIVVRILFGVFLGGLETGANTAVISIWGDDCGPYMQALHFTYSIGGILGPFITEPFLSQKMTIGNGQTNSSIKSEIFDVNSSLVSVSGNETGLSLKGYSALVVTSLPGLKQQSHGDAEKTTIAPTGTNIVYMYSLNDGTNSTEQIHSNMTMEGNTSTPSNVHFAYLITGILILTAVVPFVFMCLQTSYRIVMKKRKLKADNKKGRKMSLPVKVVSMCILSLIMLTYCSIEDNFSAYLMTFLLSSQNWTKQAGSLATSLYWASFCLGRFSGIFFVRCAKTSVILVTFLMAMPLSFMALLLGATFNLNSILWISFVLTAFSSSVVYACIFQWTEERIIPVSGKVSAMLQLSGSVGSLTTPLALGYFMEEYSPMWYVYMCLGLSLKCLVLYIVVLIVLRVFVPAPSNDVGMSEKEHELKELHNRDLNKSSK